MRTRILFGLFGFFTVMGPLSAYPQDFDGDGRDDISVYHAATGNWYIRQSTNGSLRLQMLGGPEIRPVIGDFDGDGIKDLATYRASDGRWTIRRSSNNSTQTLTLGGIGEAPVPSDYDGDGITDIATYKRTTGTWRIRLSSTGEIREENFGWFEARPVPADYDGDGKTDLAVYHRSTGNWYILGSQDGFRLQQFGYSEVRPVPADYDGDGKADLAVYERKSGTWYVLGSTDGFRLQQFGYQKTRPTPGDFDGDGKADFAVYERETGDWYLLQSNEGFRKQNWGWKNATALPSFRDGGIEGMVYLSFGDSITYGTSSACDCPATGYPALLERQAAPRLGGHFHAVNAGVPGETTTEGLRRIASWLNATRPDLVILMEGTNDHVFNTPFDTIERNLRSLITAARAAGADVILATIPPVITNQFRDRSAQAQRIQQFNPRIYAIGASMGVAIAPIHEAITAVPNWQNTLIDQPTANHPNDAGYRIVRDTFLKVIEDGIISGLYW